MEHRLPRDAHGHRADKRRSVHERRVEAERLREADFLRQAIPLLARLLRGVERHVHVTVHPRKPAVDAMPRRELLDLLDGCRTALPGRPGGVFPDGGHQFRGARVGHRRQVRRRVTRIHTAEPVALEKRDLHARLLQQDRRGHAGDAAADDHDVRPGVGLQRTRRGQRHLFPERPRAGLPHSRLQGLSPRAACPRGAGPWRRRRPRAGRCGPARPPR